MKSLFKYASLLAAAVMLFSCHGYYDPNDPANGGSGGLVDDGVLRIKSDKNLIQTFGGDYAMQALNATGADEGEATARENGED